MLNSAVLFIDSFLSSFLQVSISGVVFLAQPNKSRLGQLGLWLVQIAHGPVRFRKLKFIGLNVWRGLPYTAKGVIVLSQANISLANIYQLELIDVCHGRV